MTIIKFDVSDSDPEKAQASGKPPKPGIYKAKVKECKEGFAKGENGKPDKEKRRIEVIFTISEGKHKGFPLYDYISFGEASKWKLDQFLQALGFADTKKRKGQFDTTKVIGMEVQLRVKNELYNGDDTAKIGAILPPVADDDDEDEIEDDEDEELEDDEEVEDDEDEDEDEDEDDDSEDEEDDEEDEDEDDSDDEDDEDEDEEEEPAPVKGKKAKPAPAPAPAKKKAAPAPEPAKKKAKAKPEPEPEDDEDVPDYDEWSLPDLKEECETRGLKAVGSKTQLITRLRKFDAEDPFAG